MKNLFLWLLLFLIVGTIFLDIFIFNRININQHLCIPSGCTGNICTQDCNGGKSYLIVWIITVIIILLSAYWVYLLKQRKTSFPVSN